MELLSRDFLGTVGFRWLHILAGIAWIGLLYYFNFVQVPAFAAYGDEGRARNIAIDKVARKALWWFRWAAMSTLITGLLITGLIEDYYQDFMNRGAFTGHDAAILIGMLYGTTMAANVWMVIWPKQRIVLANAVNVLNGAEADPAAATAGRQALLASRQNVVFSVAMLFFMVGAAHFYGSAFADITTGAAWTWVLIAVVIGAVLELNCLGKLGGTATTNKLLWPYEHHKNAIISAFVLWAVLWLLSEIMF